MKTIIILILILQTSTYKNTGICKLEIISSVSIDLSAKGVSTIENGGEIYALVADGNAGLTIINVSDP